MADQTVLNTVADQGDTERSVYGASTRSRYPAALLSLGVCAVMLLVLLSMAALRSGPAMTTTTLTALKLTPPPEEKHQAHAGAKAPAKAATVQKEARVMPKLPPRVQIKNPDKVEWPEGFVHMSHAELANADISKIHSTAGGGNGNANGGGGGTDGDNGPGSSRLYNAEWYHKPSKNALASYIRPGQSTGRWAEIKCRTIPDWHVEDCQELGEEPRGTGMARVLREAAWQFLVRPPRVNGKSLIGAWVSIHYDFIQAKETDRVEPDTQ